MLIVSWNVAGLKPALQRIHSDYCGGDGGGGRETKKKADPPSSSSSSSTTSSPASSSSSRRADPLGTFLRLHGDVDVLCLQEHKVPHRSLSDRSEPHRCSSVVGYESFWSCASDPRCRGFNGVVTYARSGLVRSADSSPLGVPDLDDQGRCVVTDHGGFVLFNVYAPCGSDSGTLPRKMRFLHALRDAMDRQRREFGRKVMLVGDMNLTVDRRDVHWEDRCVNVDEVLERHRRRLRRLRRRTGGEEQEGEEDGNEKTRDDGGDAPSSFPSWHEDVARRWDAIERALRTLEATPRRTTNPSTGATFDRFRARVRVGSTDDDDGGGGGGGGGGKFVMLGDYEDTVEDALSRYSFDKRTYVDPILDSDVVHRKRNVISVRKLSELMAKIGDVRWDERTRRQIANSDDAKLNPDSPPLLWMKDLMDGDDGMVDVFRHHYPNAEARFTCWHQFTQKRYTNEGARIDYTLVDRSLMEYVESPPPTPAVDGGTSPPPLLRCGGGAGMPSTDDVDPLSEEAALMAATARGLYESGSYAGGGIAPATRRALDTQFVGAPHTGMIYTPPSYSDHVAVSLLMTDDFSDRVGKLDLVGDAPTRRAQPHKRQKSISSFFSVGSTTSSSSNGFPPPRSFAVAGAGEKRTATSQETAKMAAKKKSLHSFFGNTNAVARNENCSAGGTNPSSNRNRHRTHTPPPAAIQPHIEPLDLGGSDGNFGGGVGSISGFVGGGGCGAPSYGSTSFSSPSSSSLALPFAKLDSS